MIHNLTDKQLQTLRKIIYKIQAGEIEESFLIGITPRQGFREVVMLNRRDESGWLDSGILIALVADNILEHNPSISNRYTVTARAYEVADFDFDNPDPGSVNLYGLWVTNAPQGAT